MVNVVFSKDKNKIAAFQGLPWSYLGDGEGYSQAEAILGSDKRKFLGKDIERIVSDIRDNFIDYIGYASTFQANKVLWYSARVASKSFSQMNMFHHYVYFKLIESYTVSKSNHLFVVSDSELWVNLQNAHLLDLQIHGQIKLGFLNWKPWEKIKYNLQFFSCFLCWVIFKFFLPSPDPRNKNVLLHSFIDKRVFLRLPEYNDPYFGELENFLNTNQHDVLRITPVWVGVRSAFKLKKHFKNIVLLLTYLKLTDFFRVFFTRMCIKCVLPHTGAIKDIELLNLLLKNEEKRENETKDFQLYLFNYYCYKNLAQKLPLSASIIYTFENQPWEKMLNLALGKGLKKIAYQHTIISANWLDYRTSVFEKEAPLPDIILASGRNWLNFLKKYYVHFPLEDAGAIRLKHLFTQPRSCGDKKSKRIVVALPILPEIALALQKHILDCLASGKFNAYRFVIKSHPCLVGAALLSEKFSSYTNCEVTENSLKELLESCALLITSGSTAAFEALSWGVKTLYFVPETVSIGSEYFIRKYLEVAFADDFSEKLLHCLGEDIVPASFDVKEFFSHPDYAVFLRHLTKANKPEYAISQRKN